MTQATERTGGHRRRVAVEPSIIVVALRSRRLELGLTQKALSEEVGCHPSYITQVENGWIEPSVLMAERIALAMGMRVTLAYYGIGVAG